MINNDKIIMIDIDNTIYPLIEAILPLYNKKYNDNLRIEQIKSYDIRESIKQECANFFDEFVTEKLYLDNAPYDNSVEILTKLNKSYKILFVTAGSMNSLWMKHLWLKKYFPFYESNMFVRLHHKQLMRGDVLIDDAPFNLINGDYAKILFTMSWNQTLNAGRHKILRMDKWDDNTYQLIEWAINPDASTIKSTLKQSSKIQYNSIFRI